MGEHNHPKPVFRVDAAALRRRATTGAVTGLVIGILGLAVGVLRAAVFMLSGGRVAADGFFPLAALYALAFTFAGTAVGILWPLRASLVGRYALGFLAAGIVSSFIVRAMEGPFAAWTTKQLGMLAIGTIFFGSVVGLQIGKQQ